MDWKTLVTPFAKPLGAIFNKGLTAGSTALLVYAVDHGWPMDAVAPIVSALVLVLSTVVSGFASTQGIQIPIINDDKTNGVKVVDAREAAPSVNAPK